MGSPDERQIDGLGGADPLTSKVGHRVALRAAGRGSRVPVRAGADQRGARRHDAQLRQHAGGGRPVRDSSAGSSRRAATRRRVRILTRNTGMLSDVDAADARAAASPTTATRASTACPARRRRSGISFLETAGSVCGVAAADGPRRRHVRWRAGDVHRQRHARRRHPRGRSRRAPATRRATRSMPMPSSRRASNPSGCRPGRR